MRAQEGKSPGAGRGDVRRSVTCGNAPRSGGGGAYMGHKRSVTSKIPASVSAGRSGGIAHVFVRSAKQPTDAKTPQSHCGLLGVGRAESNSGSTASLAPGEKKKFKSLACTCRRHEFIKCIESMK